MVEVTYKSRRSTKVSQDELAFYANPKYNNQITVELAETVTKTTTGLVSDKSGVNLIDQAYLRPQ